MHVAKKYSYLFLQMVRIRTTVLMFIFVAIGSSAAFGDVRFNLAFIPACLATAFVYVFSTSLNDVSDEAIDNINLIGQNKERPLVKGNAKSRALINLSLLCAVLSLSMASFLGLKSVGITALALLYAAAYSLWPVRISYRGTLAPLTLPLVYVLYTLTLGYWSVSNPPHKLPFALLAGLYVGFFGRLMLKDLRDVKGDKKFGKRTFTVRYGVVATAQVSAAAWLIAGLLLCWQVHQNLIASILLGLTCFGIILHLLFLAKEKVLNRQLIFVASIGRLANLILLLILLSLVHGKAAKINLLLVAITAIFWLMMYETDLYLKNRISR